jgi:hypothetical protein
VIKRAVIESVSGPPEVIGCPRCKAARWHADISAETFGLILTCLECRFETTPAALLEAGKPPVPSPAEGAGSEEGASPGGG